LKCALAWLKSDEQVRHNHYFLLFSCKFPLTHTEARDMTDSSLPLLTALEVRVLGVLAEKQLTTPDYYPLSLNALVAGCNQKTSRDPVMDVGEDEVQGVLDTLKERKLVTNTWGASRRVVRYSHNLPQVLGTDSGTTALLVCLMLRGAQTAGELRTASERLYSFADLSSVDAYLGEMVSRPSGPLVVKLSKQPGSREHRWAHLLGGALDNAPANSASPSDAGDGAETATLRAEVAALRGEVAELRRMLEEINSDDRQGARGSGRGEK
jgi:uncharacterized protein YceH (UPF0502 family)